MKASRATLLRCCKESSDHGLHHGAKAAAGPGSGGPQSKRSLTNFHRYGLLIGRHQRRSSAPASLFPVAVRAFLVYLFPQRTFFTYLLSTLVHLTFSFTKVTRCSIHQPHHASGTSSRGIEPFWLVSCY